MSATEPQQEPRTPIEVEVLGDETVTVPYGDAIYVFPASLDDADGSVLDAVDDQKLSYVIRELLGKDQWAKFKASKPKVKDYGLLFDAYAKIIGLVSLGD